MRYHYGLAFTFELLPHGELSVRAEVRGQCVWEGELRLDDCLRRRAEGAHTLDVSGVDVHLPALLTLLDRKLYSKHKTERSRGAAAG